MPPGGASYGAGVAVEVSLQRPGAVPSLTLIGPGGSLIPEATDDLRAFEGEENAALEAEPDPPALARLGEIAVPTLVLLGDLDLDANRQAAERLAGDVPGAAPGSWCGTASRTFPPWNSPPSSWTSSSSTWPGRSWATRYVVRRRREVPCTIV